MPEYFRLMQDRRIPHAPVMINLNRIHHYREAQKGDVLLLRKLLATPVQSSSKNTYPAVLDRQLFMVKPDVYQVLQMYAPDLECRTIYLLDPPNQRGQALARVPTPPAHIWTIWPTILRGLSAPAT